MKTGILSVKDYGRISFRLKEYMDAHDINRNQLASAIGASFSVVNKWYCGKIDRMDVDIPAGICCVLGCQVQDLLTYEKAEKE